MFFRLSLGAGLIAATVVIQALFMTVGLSTFKRIEERRPGAMARKPGITTVIWILFLLIPIVLDVTLWATFYYLGGALPSFEEALYFSTVTFTCRIRGHRSRPRVASIGDLRSCQWVDHLRLGDSINNGGDSAPVFPW